MSRRLLLFSGFQQDLICHTPGVKEKNVVGTFIFQFTEGFKKLEETLNKI